MQEALTAAQARFGGVCPSSGGLEVYVHPHP